MVKFDPFAYGIKHPPGARSEKDTAASSFTTSKTNKISMDKLPPLGAMIEVPGQLLSQTLLFKKLNFLQSGLTI